MPGTHAGTRTQGAFLRKRPGVLVTEEQGLRAALSLGAWGGSHLLPWLHHSLSDSPKSTGYQRKVTSSRQKHVSVTHSTPGPRCGKVIAGPQRPTSNHSLFTHLHTHSHRYTHSHTHSPLDEMARKSKSPLPAIPHAISPLS